MRPVKSVFCSVSDPQDEHSNRGCGLNHARVAAKADTGAVLNVNWIRRGSTVEFRLSQIPARVADRY